MKIKFIFCFLFTLSIKMYGQSDYNLKYTFNEQNVISSAIDGVWKSDKLEMKLVFKKDTTVLGLLPQYQHKYFSDYVVFHAGYLTMQREGKEKIYPFILIVKNGNPNIQYFRERRGVPYGDAENFNLFVAKGKTRNEDRLFIGGDYNYEPFYEFVRIE